MQILGTVLNAIRRRGSPLQCDSRTNGRHVSDVAIKRGAVARLNCFNE